MTFYGDGLIGSQACFSPDPTALADCITGIAFQPGDKKDVLVGQSPEPTVTVVGFIENHDGALGQIVFGGGFTVMAFGFRDCDEGWDVAIMSKESVHLDTGFFAPKRGPGKNAQTQTDSAGIKAEQF